jgi:hypothetical protein
MHRIYWNRVMSYYAQKEGNKTVILGYADKK